MSANNTVTVRVDGGPTISVPWVQGLTAERAMQLAVNQTHDQKQFTYGTQFFGDQLGNLVFMINQTYDTFANEDHPFFFWDFIVNGTTSLVGIDGVVLVSGDVVEFKFTTYEPITHEGTLLQAKHLALKRS